MSDERNLWDTPCIVCVHALGIHELMPSEGWTSRCFVKDCACQAARFDFESAQQCESSQEEAPVSPGIGRPDAKVAPMSDDRLAEIEARLRYGCVGHETEGGFGYGGAVGCLCFDDFEDEGLLLVAEVRRLRRALALSEASRGVPSVGALPEITDQATWQKYRFERGAWQKVEPSAAGGD